MPTLILPPRYTSDSIRLWKTAIAIGWEVLRLQNWRVNLDGEIDNPVVYGEPLFAKIVADKLGIKLLDPQLDWLTTLPKSYVKRQIDYLTLKEAKNIKETTFIKPAFEKCFAAKIYSSGEQFPNKELLADETPVLVSEPVNWTIEFRCFVQNRQVKAISSYWSDNKSTERKDGSWYGTKSDYQEALEFCTDVISTPQIKLPDAVVVDVGKIEAKGWAVIEANSVYSSGLYGCDPRSVIEVIQAASQN